MLKKLLACFLALLMLLATGCAVQTEGDATSASNYNPTIGGYKKPPAEDKDQISDDLEEESEIPEDEWTYLVKDGVAQFVIVSASEEYDAMAAEFAQNLKDRTRVSFESVKSSKKGETWLMTKNQIVIGDTVSKILSAGETLTYNGKLSRAVKMGSGTTKIHITGHHKEAIALSKQKFLSGCLDRYFFVEKSKINFKVPNFRILFLEENLKNYVTMTPEILGKDLADYNIVFSKNMTAIDHYMATYLLEEIGTNTGYVMKTVTDATAEAECEIVFGKTSRAGSEELYDTLEQGQFAIKSVGTKIYVAYENYLVASNARAALNNLYINKVSTSIDIRQTPDYTEKYVTKADDSYVRVMTSNIVCAGDADGRETFDKGMGITWQQRVQIQGSMMLAYLPDFIGLQEMQEGDTYGVALMHTELKKVISSEYTFVEYEGMGQNTYWNPIVYRHNVWNLDEKGVMAQLTGFDNSMHRWQWAKFSKIDDPLQEVVILNLHYPISSQVEAREQAGEIVNQKICELQAMFPAAEIFVTGDFNAAEGSELYNQTVEGTGLKNANTNVGAIDLVLYQESVDCKLRYSINDSFIRMTSDHRPFFADFKISN